MRDMLRAGIIGCGNVVFGGHAPALRQLEGTEVIGIADPTVARRQQVQTVLGLADDVCFDDYRDLLAKTPDYVLVATPQRFRRPIVEDCARAGIHVLSEKPIATIPADAAAMIAQAETANVRYGMNHNYLYYPEYQLARELIEQGAIGTLRHLTLNFLGVPDKPGAREYRPLWRHDPHEAGGGILMDMIHAVYLVEYMLGEPIIASSALVDNLDHPGEQVEDFTLVHFLSNSGYATVNMWWGNGPGGFEISGTEGRIMVFYQDYGTGPFTQIDSFTLVNREGRQSFEPRTTRPQRNGTANIHEDFADAIRNNREPLAPAASGARALSATLAAYTSAATGRVIKLPFEPQHPVFLAGVVGIRELEVWQDGPLARHGVFGL